MDAWCDARPFAAGEVRAALEGVAAAFGVSLEAATIYRDEFLGDGMTSSGRVGPADLDEVTDVVATRADVQVRFPLGARLSSLEVSGRMRKRIGVAASGSDAASVRAAVGGLIDALRLTRSADL